jgi:hypothetical protein
MTLALLLSGTVLTIASSVIVQSAKVERSSRRIMSAAWERWRLFEVIEADAKAILTSLPEDVELVTTGVQEPVILELVTLAAISEVGGIHRRRMPARVTYLLEESPGSPAGKRLVRSVQDLTRADSAQRQIIGRGLYDVRVELLDGEREKRPNPKQRPTAIRVICRWDNAMGDSLQRTLLVPRSDGVRGRTER